MIAGMDVIFETIYINPYAANASPEAKKFQADLDSGLILNPNTKHPAPEPAAPIDVQQANQQLNDGVQTMKRALERVDYDMRQKRPDIISDMGFHYGAHVRPMPEFYTSVLADGSMEQTKRVADKGYEERGYDSATSSAWDFTVEDGQFRVYSKWVSKGQYDYATKGDAGEGASSWGGTEMVQAVSKDQMDVIQKTLNDNKELLKGVTQLLNGIQGGHESAANAPRLLLKELIMDAEKLALQETGRAGKNYQDLNKAETATFFRRTAHGLDKTLQTTNNINTYA
jgi:hypothetical protein